MAKYAEQSIERYITDLASKLPAPGGGSSAALVACNGVSLLSMSANFTLDKKGYEQYQCEVANIAEQLAFANKRLLELLDLDVAAFDSFSAVYKMPGNTEEEKAARGQKMQETLKAAMQVPYDIFRVCGEVLIHAARLLDIGNKNLVSDVGCGAVFLAAAMRAAKMNIDINLKSISDAGLSGRVREETERELKASLEIADRVSAIVEQRIKP